MAGVLTATSMPTRTSPSKRGKWVLDTILGSPAPPPLPDAPALKEEGKEVAGLTLRQRLDKHRADSRCAACHQLIDPVGFGFENYDALGAWRESAETTATLPDGRSFTGAIQFKDLLLGRRDEFVRCLAEKVLTYALGRGLECGDAAVVREIGRTVAAADYRMSALILEVVRSYPFQHRRNMEVSND
jgi:hypothetical protein